MFKQNDHLRWLHSSSKKKKEFDTLIKSDQKKHVEVQKLTTEIRDLINDGNDIYAAILKTDSRSEILPPESILSDIQTAQHKIKSQIDLLTNTIDPYTVDDSNPDDDSNDLRDGPPSSPVPITDPQQGDGDVALEIPTHNESPEKESDNPQFAA